MLGPVAMVMTSRLKLNQALWRVVLWHAERQIDGRQAFQVKRSGALVDGIERRREPLDNSGR